MQYLKAESCKKQKLLHMNAERNDISSFGKESETHKNREKQQQLNLWKRADCLNS